jgi:hypothetical protein
MNPQGAFCLGASNTTTVVLGKNAITIDNSKTPARIYINEAPFFYIPVPGTLVKDFSNLIPSRAGFNPAGALRIGIRNTEFLDIGLLKIDNTVVPPQVFANDVALPPVESPEDTNQYNYYTNADAIGDQDTLPNTVSFEDDTTNTVVSLFNNGDGINNVLKFTNKGVYEIVFKADIVADGFPVFELLGSIYLTSMVNDSILNPNTGLYLVANDTIPQSDIVFTNGTSSKTITFNIVLTESNTVIGVGTNMPGDITFSAYSGVSIRQIGTLP